MRRLRESARLMTAARAPHINLPSLPAARHSDGTGTFRCLDSFRTTALWKHFLPLAEQSAPVP